MADGYDMHVGLNRLHIIMFKKNLYEKSGKWIRYMRSEYRTLRCLWPPIMG